MAAGGFCSLSPRPRPRSCDPMNPAELLYRSGLAPRSSAAASRAPSQDASGFFPTFVNEAAVYRYLDDTDAKANGVLAAWNAAPTKFTAPEIARFNSFLARWRELYRVERNSSHMLDARSTMNDIDPMVEELAVFDGLARDRGAVPATPRVTRAPDSIFNPSELPGAGTVLLLLAGIAAVVLIAKS